MIKNVTLALFTALIILATRIVYVTPSIEVSYINVGQGDSALLRDSNGFDVLIDGGKPTAGPAVVAYLREQGVDDIDIMVASHPDSDHIGGLIDVLEMTDIPVESVLYNGYPGETVTWNTFVKAVAVEGLSLTAVQFPQKFTWGAAKATILNPEPGLINPETDDASLVILIEHGSNSFLFTGDIDRSIEPDVLVRGSPLAVDILKVAEHGSAYSSSELFLSVVQPKEAIISVGNNSYGHPSSETLARLNAVGARTWRTDRNGTIWVTSDGMNYTVSAERMALPFPNLLFLPITIRQ